MIRSAFKKCVNGLQSGRGVMLVVIVMLFSSGFVRIADGAGEVIAEEMVEKSHSSEWPVDTLSDPNPDIEAIMTALNERSRRIDAQEAALADRLAALRLAEAQIEEKLEALVAAEERLSDLVALSDGAAEGDLARLTSVYESMKPKQAAALFEKMTPDFAAGFLGRMRPDAAAAILAGMAPETAYTISVVLAGRNANAPSE